MPTRRTDSGSRSSAASAPSTSSRPAASSPAPRTTTGPLPAASEPGRTGRSHGLLGRPHLRGIGVVREEEAGRQDRRGDRPGAGDPYPRRRPAELLGRHQASGRCSAPLRARSRDLGLVGHLPRRRHPHHVTAARHDALPLCRRPGTRRRAQGDPRRGKDGTCRVHRPRPAGRRAPAGRRGHSLHAEMLLEPRRRHGFASCRRRRSPARERRLPDRLAVDHHLRVRSLTAMSR